MGTVFQITLFWFLLLLLRICNVHSFSVRFSIASRAPSFFDAPHRAKSSATVRLSSEFTDDARIVADDSSTRLVDNAVVDDSLEQYEKDVTKVLRELRPWKYDPSVPGWFRTRKLSFTNYWSLEEWELHTSRLRYFRYIIDFPKSRLLHRIYPQLTVLLIWCLLSVRLAQHFHLHHRLVMAVPETASLSLVSTFVAAIQTLRSNQGLGRLADARHAMGRMVLYTRDLGT